MKKRFLYLPLFGVLFIFLAFLFSSYKKPVINYTPPEKFSVNDTIDDDTLKYPFKDYSNTPSLIKIYSPLYLKNPSNINSSVEYDAKSGEFIFYDKIGDIKYRNPHYMSFDDYMEYNRRNTDRKYWKEKAALESPRVTGGLIDRLINKELIVKSKTFDKIFGSNKISIKPQGSAELIFGLNINKTDNQALAKDLRKSVTFSFDEKIKLGINGKIGDKLSLGINYDTEATFEFENNVKLAYEGEEDDIIQKIEAGNISLPLSGTLITGSHSLWGLKTEFKFGKLTMTSVLSQQKGEIQTIEVEGGAMSTPFEIDADDYESGRHFFLTHYFRDNYNDALKNLPVILSEINITKVEVWVTNRSGNFQDSRNIVAFTDLGETRGYLLSDQFTARGEIPQNGANTLYREMNGTYSGIRNINTISTVLMRIPNFSQGADYEKLQNARMLSSTEFSFSPSLGYISLNSSLNNDEVLAIAFEYTFRGDVYRVGEFASESTDATQTLILKLLKPTMLSTKLPTWDLMMKNVYSINAYQVNSQDFVFRVMYRNDKTGSSIDYLPAGNIDGQILLQVMGLDNLNKNNEPGRDGYFDFMDKVTINASNGKIIFPVLEPFGEHLRMKITGGDTLNPELNGIAEQYVFRELYDKTQSQARQVAEKNKFFMKGEYRSAGGSEINLNAMNVPEGSVKVTAGGRELIENDDYTVDYNLGRVTILNQGLLESGMPIKISLENNSMFNIGTKTFLGTHLDYRFNENFNIGATILRLNQKPLTKKINIGNEPITNTMWGVDINLNQEVPFLTKLVDKIPFIETKEKSTIDFTGEFAHLIPGHPKVIGKDGFAHIDDFESTRTTRDLKSPYAWKLASTPQGQPDIFPEGELAASLQNGYNRAKLAWYVVNTDFLRSGGSTPDHISQDDQSDHRVREVYERELFPNRDPVHSGMPAVLSVLNLAFYPQERGPYNYDVSGVTGISEGINPYGNLISPETRWGGVMRDLITTDFEQANIEFIEFWLMDPYINNPESTNQGDLYFNFGNVSEDILRDSRQSFENGLPSTLTVKDVDETVWGRVPVLPRITDAFAKEPQDAGQFQDAGLDGLLDVDEKNFFSEFLRNISSRCGGTGSAAYLKALNDPSNDNFMFFKSAEYDARKASILERYKHYNNLEHNTFNDNTSNTTSSSGHLLPDMEDINHDFTLSETETYFQYRVRISSEVLNADNPYITDVKVSNVTLKNKDKANVTWYRFKIPLSDFEDKIGNIEDFKSIRFVRMFMRGWNEEIILRFAELNLVRGEWRKYKESLLPPQEGTGGQLTDALLDVSAVNVEENSSRSPVNYLLPPGVTREISAQQPQYRELNEQSITLKVTNLSAGDDRAAYKNVTLDVRQFKKLQMYIHAEAIKGENDLLRDDDFCAFIRLGSDYRENYYEYEIPLKVTREGIYPDDDAGRYAVWPAENMLDVEFDLFQGVKQRRNSRMREPGSSHQITYKYTEEIENGRRVSIAGNPNLSNIRTIMIGVRNRKDNGTGLTKNIEVWMNELRLSGFKENGGWAANARLTARLADFSTVTIGGHISTPGFGSIEKRVSERQQSTDFGYEFSTNVELGKFFPKKYGVRIPVFYSQSESFSNPEYNPLDPDILLSTTISDPNLSKSEKDSILHYSQDYVSRKSFNVTNLRINGNSEKKKKKKKKSRGKSIFHISNWSAGYGYNEVFIRNINIDHNILREHNTNLSYNFNNSPKNVVPFRRVKFLNKKIFKIIKDVNFYYAPTLISFQNIMAKRYNEVQLRDVESGIQLETNYDKQFTWSRNYDLKYNLTKALKLSYSAKSGAWIDEAKQGSIRKDYEYWKENRDTLWNSLTRLGRATDYTQKIEANWNIPINKIPLLGWTNANARYATNYFWERGPEGIPDTIVLGNSIRNSQEYQLTGQLNFTRLYRNVKFLKTVDDEMKRGRKNKKKKYKEVSYERSGLNLKKGRPKRISHNLKTDKEIKLNITDDKGKKVNGVTEVINLNTVKFIPDTTVKNVKIVVTGKKEKKDNIFKILKDYTLYALMSVRNFSFTYSANNGTVLPGYMKETDYFGLDNWGAPGWDFIMGLQDSEFARKAALKGWLSGDQYINTPVSMTNNVTYSYRSTLQPIKGLRIDVSGRRTSNYREDEFWVNRDGQFIGERMKFTGNFSMSFIAIKTAFWKMGEDSYYSRAYDNFLENRSFIAAKLSDKRINAYPTYDPTPLVNEYSEFTHGGYPAGFSPTSQEVLLPSFLAAYSGVDIDKQNLNPFPIIPMPNWRLRYDGLTKYDFIKRLFKKIMIDHAYNSNYSVGSYENSLFYNFEHEDVYGYSFATDSSGLFIPKNIMDGGVIIDERFVPLIGVDMTWKNDLSTRFEYKQTRNLSLSFRNSTVIEMLSKEYTIGIGYKIPDLEIPLKIGKKQSLLKSDLNLRADITYRDRSAVTRTIANSYNQLTDGQKNISIKIDIDYDISSRVTLRLFYDQVINNPKVSTAFRTSNTKIGFSIRFNLLPK